METMSWRDIKEMLNKLPEDNLDDTATIYIQSIDEYYGITGFTDEDTGGVLDEGHSYLVLKTEVEVD
jgi:hypothetical protein